MAHGPRSLLVWEPFVLVGGSDGLFAFDRQARQLHKLSNDHVLRISRSPFGPVVAVDVRQSPDRKSLLVQLPHRGEPVVTEIVPKKGDDWRKTLGSDPFLTVGADGRTIVAINDAAEATSLDVSQLNVELRPYESLEDVFGHYAGKTWLLTERRLIAVDARSLEVEKYPLRMPADAFVVQYGELWAGPIRVRTENGEICAEYVSVRHDRRRKVMLGRLRREASRGR